MLQNVEVRLWLQEFLLLDIPENTYSDSSLLICEIFMQLPKVEILAATSIVRFFEQLKVDASKSRSVLVAARISTFGHFPKHSFRFIIAQLGDLYAAPKSRNSCSHKHRSIF